MVGVSSIWLDIRSFRSYEVGPDMIRHVMFRMALLLSMILPLYINAESAGWRDIFGQESRLSLEETRGLVEQAGEAAGRGEHALALEILQRALRVTESRVGTNNQDAANLHILIGEWHMQVGEVAQANTSLTRALQIAEPLLGKDHAIVGRALMGLAVVEGVSGSSSNALRLSNRALQILSTAYGSNSLAVAGCLEARAVQLYSAGLLNDAEAAANRSREIYKAKLGKDDFRVGGSHSGLAIILEERGRYQDAITNYHEAKRIFLLATSAGDPSVLLLDVWLASCFERIGAYADATLLLDNALPKLEMTFGRDSLQAGVALNVIGRVAASRGNYAQAEDALTRCMEAAEKGLGPNSAGYARAVNNLLTLLRLSGNPSGHIEQLYETSVRIIGQTSGPRSPHLADVLVGWAVQLGIAGKEVEAVEKTREALRIYREVFGEGHPKVVETLAGLAYNLALLRRFDEALPMVEQAVATSRSLYDAEDAALAGLLAMLGEVLDLAGNKSQAIDYFEKAVAIRTRHPQEDGRSAAYGYMRLADTQAALGLQDASLTNLLLASEAMKRAIVRQASGASEPAAMAMAGDARFGAGKLHSMVGICARAGSAQAPVAGASDAAANKGLVEEVQSAQSAIESSASVATRELASRYQQLLAKSRDLAKGAVDPVEGEKRRREVQASIKEVEDQMAGRITAVGQLMRDRNCSVLGICETLPREAVLIDLVWYWRHDFAAATNQWREPRYAAYLTFPLAKGSTNALVERVDLGEAIAIEAAVGTITKRMAAGQFAASGLSNAVQRVSELVYAPLAKHLTNVSHLIVCPDGQLSRLPFEMLRHNGKFLIEEKTISYVGSGREIVRLAGPAKAANTNAPLVLGNPDFNLDLIATPLLDEALASKAATPKTNAPLEPGLLASVSTRSLSRDYRGLKFAPLPGAEAEARSMAGLLGADAVLRLGADAREADLKRAVSPRVLHLATHGFFLSDQEFKRTNAPAGSRLPAGAFAPRRLPPGEEWENPMVRCGIALAGANRTRQITNALAEDGLLTGLEASLLNLQGTELVILSACDSGTGDVKIGEGVMSLRRAFRIAGAQTVLASHWKVSDKATGLLMTEFMRRWRAGEPRSQAWRQAQLSLLRSKDFSNPFFWAAFTLTGQWK